MRGERGFLSAGRQKEGEIYFIGGRNSVLESLRAGQVKKVFIKSGKKDSRLLALAEEAERLGIAAIETEERELDRLAEGVRHQGGGCVFKAIYICGLGRGAFVLWKKGSHTYSS